MATKYFNFNNEQGLFPIEVDDAGRVRITVDGASADFDSVQEFAENYAVARNVLAENLKNWELLFDKNKDVYSFILKAGTAGVDIDAYFKALSDQGVSPEDFAKAISETANRDNEDDEDEDRYDHVFNLRAAFEDIASGYLFETNESEETRRIHLLMALFDFSSGMTNPYASYKQAVSNVNVKDIHSVCEALADKYQDEGMDEEDSYDDSEVDQVFGDDDAQYYDDDEYTDAMSNLVSLSLQDSYERTAERFREFADGLDVEVIFDFTMNKLAESRIIPFDRLSVNEKHKLADDLFVSHMAGRSSLPIVVCSLSASIPNNDGEVLANTDFSNRIFLPHIELEAVKYVESADDEYLRRGVLYDYNHTTYLFVAHDQTGNEIMPMGMLYENLFTAR